MNLKTSVLVSALIGLAMISFACSKPEKGHDMAGMEGMSMTSADQAMKQTMTSMEAKIGDWVICPVQTGNRFQVKVDSLFAEIDGKKIYVCCKECIDLLKKDPKKYL